MMCGQLANYRTEEILNHEVRSNEKTVTGANFNGFIEQRSLISPMLQSALVDHD